MANNRKIQGEIDKLLKKIQEGMEIYDEISEKVANANEKSLKERIEGDLKSQIKKLQRCRDSVKQYVANPEVKDKRALEEARRAIERKMEAFKVTERETKTKAFSKEGLIAAARDPNDPKSLTSVWLREFISELKEKIEQLEFDVENEAVSGAAAAKKGKGKTEDPEERLERARHHVFRLEQLLRLLNRDELEAQDIDDIRDSVTEFVENVLDMNYEEVDTELYDVFGLPDEAEDDSDDDDSDNSDDSDSDDEEAASRKAANKQKPAATTAPSTLSSAPAATSGGGKVVSSPTMSRQSSSAVSDEKKPATPATPATAKQAPTPTSGATTGKKQPPPALPATSTTASAPSPSNVATGKKQQTPLSSTAAKQTPNSPNKNSFGNNQFNSEPLSHEGSKDNFATMSSEQFGGGNNNNNNNNNDDGLGDDDDAFNDDTFGDDAMNAVDSGATLGDLSAMSANNNKGGKQTAMTAPANVWAAKKPVGGIAAASTNSSGASSTSGSNNNNANATAALPSGGPTLDSLSAFGGGSSKTPTTAAGTGAGVKSAWSQPLSSLGGVGPKLDAKSPSLAEMFGAAAAASTQPGSKETSFQPTPSKNVAPSNNNNNNNNNTMTMNSSNVPPDPAIIAAVPVSNNNNNSNKQNQNQLQQQQDQQQQSTSSSSSIPTSVSGAAASSTATPTPSVTLTAASTMRMLDMSVRNLPHASDVERLKPYVPANPQPTPNYYPQKVPACFSDPTLFQKFEPDTLFFIFYYQQGSYQHYLAAKELKRNSYRFHKKFTTWFQRHDRPKSLNEEQEQGTYVYFDFESGWCQRIKNDFSFRYTYLENELV